MSARTALGAPTRWSTTTSVNDTRRGTGPASRRPGWPRRSGVGDVRLIVAAVAVVAIVGVFVAVTVTSGDDGETATDRDHVDDRDHHVRPRRVTAPPPGEAIDGATPCPPADGSAARTTAFTEAPPTCIDEAKTYTAEVATSEGDITIDLDAANAPITVNNFVVLARYHYFDGLPFHRIVPGFVNQTGELGRARRRQRRTRLRPARRAARPREYAAGDVAMAQGGGTNSGSQFFFVDRSGEPAGRHVPDLRQGERRRTTSSRRSTRSAAPTRPRRSRSRSTR